MLPTPTAFPTVSFGDTVRAQVKEAIVLIVTANKTIPTSSSRRARTLKLKIVKARKDLNGKISILANLLKTDASTVHRSTDLEVERHIWRFLRFGV